LDQQQCQYHPTTTTRIKQVNRDSIMSYKTFIKYWTEMEHSKHISPPSSIVPALYNRWKALLSASSQAALSLEYVDRSSLVTKANHSLQSSNNNKTKQDKAQHDTLRPEGVCIMLEKCAKCLNHDSCIAEDDVVLDVGSGTGMVLCQLAATMACRKVIRVEIDGNWFYKGWFERYLQDRRKRSRGLHAKVLDQMVRLRSNLQYMHTCVHVRPNAVAI